jgi:hypothetical protein
MSNDAAVYDLGEIDAGKGQPRPTPAAVPPQQATRLRATPQSTVIDRGPRRSRSAWSVGFALFLPGAGHLLSAEFASGMAFLASIGFIGTLIWAIVGTLDRLGPTLALVGLPAQGGLWALGLLYFAAAAVHVINVFSAARDQSGSGRLRGPHPIVAGLASLLIPGWGQALNGNRKSAALFLSSCWIVGAAWILVTPAVQELLAAEGLYLPRGLTVLSSPLVRWTVPALIWALAIYDAAARAARGR